MPKRGLALEGGGARGAYHMGVCKAYIEKGYTFDGVVGTSIGAINAAMLVSDKFDKCVEIWNTIELDHIFDREFLDALNVDSLKPSTWGAAIKKLINDRGVDHTKIKEFLNTHICEDTVRNSGLDFGLVTYSLSERKPYEVFLKDIPEGKLVDYILASAKLPFLSAHVVDESRFIDGGFYNSCPINMLIDAGYDEIIAVRTKSFGRFRRFDKKANVTLIETSESLGNFLQFDPESSKSNIKRGYCDALRQLDHLEGNYYYLKDAQLQPLVTKLLNLQEPQLRSLPSFSDATTDVRRLLLEKIIPDLADFLELEKNFSYEAFILGMLEFVALRKKIPRFDVYSFDEFLKLIRVSKLPKPDHVLARVGIDLLDRKSNLVCSLVEVLN